MTLLLLALLALADVTFSAFRDAAGRNPRIEKTSYYRRAMLGGLLCGLFVLALCMVVRSLLLGQASNSEFLMEDMGYSGGRMVAVYGSYATLVLLALGVWRVGDSELRTLMSVAILGPLTLLRHVLIPVGFLVAVLAAERWETRGLALLGVMLVGSMERIFGAIRRQRQGRLWPGEPRKMAH